MRKVQINIKMELFGDQAVNEHSEKIEVFADGSAPWEVVCAGFEELIIALKEKGRTLPAFGVREHY